tara:strand:+ start:1307 stop:1675 length:369 start_codon:yes stop_codon:yes gene_type:complete
MSKNGSKWIAVERRWQIYSRDNLACVYCWSCEDLTLDHVDPTRRKTWNGRDIEDHSNDNLVTCCRSCNSKKHTKSLDQFAPPAIVAKVRLQLALDIPDHITAMKQKTAYQTIGQLPLFQEVA